MSSFCLLEQIKENLHYEVLSRSYQSIHSPYNLHFSCFQIVSIVETNQVTVIQGGTGCGKTTQVPQFILDSCVENGIHCNIIITQPRRIAAIAVAKRVSEERNWPLGTLVGYQVGLNNKTSRDTRLTFCTTGVLLQKFINKKNMDDYTHVILDEVHERDQDMDFAFLIVRKLLCTNSCRVKVSVMYCSVSSLDWSPLL
jgi:ATP-dependent RNA helicase TDRD9